MNILSMIAEYISGKMKYNSEFESLKKDYIEEAYNMNNEELKPIISLIEAYIKSNEDDRAKEYGKVCEELKRIYNEKQTSVERIKKH